LVGLEALARQVKPDAVLYAPHVGSCARQAADAALQLGVPFLLIPAIHIDRADHTNRAARRFYRSATLVAALSDIERSWLLDCAGVDDARIVSLGCGCRTWSDRPPRQFSRHQRVRLLTVGAFVPHKQLSHQIEALARLRQLYGVDARLTIAGTLGDRHLVDRLRGTAESKRVGSHVEIAINGSDEQIARFYAESDYFLFTSRSESFGIALLEAIACGTFPVAYPHPVYRALIESAGFGVLAERQTADALAAALNDALLSPPIRDEERRLRWLLDRSWPNVVRPLANALERIAGAGARRIVA
jgi:glycosyltransferase involved in cell wall biosynthesis